jgi:hypothetical protein
VLVTQPFEPEEPAAAGEISESDPPLEAPEELLRQLELRPLLLEKELEPPPELPEGLELPQDEMPELWLDEPHDELRPKLLPLLPLKLL